LSLGLTSIFIVIKHSYIVNAFYSDSLFPSISITSQNLAVLNPLPAKLISLSSNDRSLSLLDAMLLLDLIIPAVDCLNAYQHNLYICKVDNILQSDSFLNHILYVITYDFSSSEVRFFVPAVSSEVESFIF
jgi:hypothetical protein